MKTAVTYYSSKIHRYLGIFIGIQFFLWTIGGLYFSWTNIKEIRGEHLRKKQEVVSLNAKVVSFEKAITTIKASGDFIDLQKLQLVSVMGKPFYEIVVSNKSGESNTILADAIAMPTHGRKGISHLFNGSIGEDVVNHARIPVITFKI